MLRREHIVNEKKIEQLEQEVKLLNNEVKQVLVDVREYLVTYAQNPFSRAAPPPRKEDKGAPEPVPASEPPRSVESQPGLGRRGEDEVRPLEGLKLMAIGGNGHGGNGYYKGGNGHNGHNGNGSVEMDLLSLGLMSEWLRDGIRRIGKQRLEALIEIYEMMQGIPPSLKDIVIRLIHLDATDGPANGNGATIMDCIDVLVRLDGFLMHNHNNKAEVAALSMLLSQKEVMPSIR